MIRLRCPSCGAEYTLRPELAGKRVVCRRCQARCTVPGPLPAKALRQESDAEEDSARPPVVRPRQREEGQPSSPQKEPERPERRFSLAQKLAPLVRPEFVSLMWLGVGLNLALAAPWLILLPAPLAFVANLVPLVITTGLIAWNFAAALRVAIRTGHLWAALPLTLVQICLFTLLFFQIASHLGPAHFTWRDSPAWWEWPLFSAVHALRASDLVDFIEAYGLRFQTIDHAGAFTAGCLILFHLILDLFFIRLVMQVVNAIKLALVERFNNEGVRLIIGLAVVVLVLGWLITAFLARPWRGVDFILWPLDNLLHVVDFADAMALFHVRLHQVPEGVWESTLTFACRLFLAIALADLLNRARIHVALRWFRGLDISEYELDQIAKKHKNKTLRKLAKQRLRELDAEADQAEERGAQPVWGLGWSLAAGVGLVCLALAWLVTDRRGAAAQLASLAVERDNSSALAALSALEGLGSFADEHAPALAAALPNMPRDRQLQAVRTLAWLGPKGTGAAAVVLGGTDKELALVAARNLSRRTRDVGPLLLRGLASPHAEVRQLSEAGLAALGSPELQAQRRIMAGIVAQLRDIESVEARRSAAVNINTKGALYAGAVPALIQQLDDPVESVREAVALALGKMGDAGDSALPALRGRLEDKHISVRLAAACALVALDPGDEGPATLLKTTAADSREPVSVRAKAVQHLGALKSPAKVIAAALPFLQDTTEVGLEAIRLLGSLGPAGAPAVAILGKRLDELRQKKEAAAAPPEGYLSPAEEIAEALARIGSAAAGAAPALIAELELIPYVPYQSPKRIDSLIKMGPTVIPDVVRFLDTTKSAAGKGHAVRVLRGLGLRRDPEILPALIRALPSQPRVDDEFYAFVQVAGALGELGPAAREAVPVLVKFLDYPAPPPDSNFVISPPSLVARSTLDKIDPGWRNQYAK